MSDVTPSGNGNGYLPPALREEGDEPTLTNGGTVGTDFLPFATGAGANIEDQTSYLNDPQRPTGNLPGIARSNFVNKAIRQGTFVAHSLCLWISEQIQAYVPDDGSDINWIGEFSEALAQFILQVLPPGPNLGAYLPLAGGTMVGNIQFMSGISTIMSNNTWYYGKDTTGQSRGLLLKGSDNNVYLNDGSAPYVIFGGSPLVANGVYYGGRGTDSVAHGLIGLLSDNATHIASGSAGHVYIDTSASGSVWIGGGAGNLVLNNQSYYYCKDTGASPRAVMGMNNANALLIGSGVTGTTEIYGAGNINLHNTTVALGQFNVNGPTYLGFTRSYIPGGNDPLQIYADQGYYARLHYIVGGIRDWSEGCLASGLWGLADETAHAVRLECDGNGLFTFFNNVQINGAATVNGGVTIGALTVTGAAQVNGGLAVYNSLNVASGSFSVSGPAGFGALVTMYAGLTVSGGTTTTGPLNCGNLGASGAAQINGGLTLYNGLNVASGNASVAGTLTVGGGFSMGTGTVNGNLTVTNTLQVNNWASIYNGLTVQSGAFVAAGSGQVNGGLTVYNSINVASGGITVSAGATIGSNCNVGNTLFVSNQAQVWNHLYIQTGDLHVQAGSAYLSGGVTCAGLQINGNATVTGAGNIGGGLTVSGGIYLATGGLTVASNNLYVAGTGSFGGQVHVGQLQVGGLPYIYDNGGGYLMFAGMNIWTDASVTCSYFHDSGGVQIDGGATINGGLTVYNSINVATGNVGVNGLLQVNGVCNFYNYVHVAQLQVGGLPYQYDNGGGYLIMPFSLNVLGSTSINGNLWVGGGGTFTYGVTSGPNGGLYANSWYGVTSDGNMNITGANDNMCTFGGHGGRPYTVRADSDWLLFASATGYSSSIQNTGDWFCVMAGGVQVLSGGQAYKQGGGQWADNSERRFKRNIADYKSGLAEICKLRPRTYEFNGLGPTTDTGRTHVGLVADEVEDVMPELLGKLMNRRVGRKWTKQEDIDDPMQEVTTLDGTAIMYALVNAVKELNDRVNTLQGAPNGSASNRRHPLAQPASRSA